MEIIIVALIITIYYFYYRICEKIEKAHTQLHNKINDLEHLIKGTGTYNPYREDDIEDR